MAANNPNPPLPDDQAEASIRSAPKDHQEKVRAALIGLAEAHTRSMQQTTNRPWLMHYYDDLANHSWDPWGQIAQIAQAQGRKVVGTFCVFAPDELIYAAGGLPIRIDAGADEAIPDGEQDLGTVNICPVIKSSLGLKRLNIPFAGEARLDLALIPTVCDGKKKLVDIFARYVPTWMIQVPHTSLDPRVRDYWRTEIKLLRDNLEDFTGQKIKAKDLAEAIKLFNRKRRAIRRLYEIRKAPVPPITGRDALLVLATSYHDDPQRWTEQTERLCLELEDRVRRGMGVAEPRQVSRLMLAGCPIVPPNWKVPDILEELGGVIVTDELCTGSRGYWYLVGEEGRSVDEMVTALADRYIMCECPCFVPNTPRLKRIVESVQAWNVKGVIYYQLLFCHTLNIEAMEVERALRQVGTPMCKIDTDYSEQGAEALRTRLESFLETLREEKKQAPVRPGAAAQAPSFWMALTLPLEIAGELPMVAAEYIPSGPLSRPRGQTMQRQAQLAAAAQAPVAPKPQAPETPSPVPPPAAKPSPEPQATVQIQTGEFQLIMPGGKTIPLTAGKEYTLGRGHSESPAEIDLSEYGGDVSQVSRKHARLVVASDHCILEDLGSKNGILVNGRRLKPDERCQISGGEQVTLGTFMLHMLKG
jgi:benzoyl-CoA reductase/2-hydroxyglutaryl-CoA dehydratase subunit BcrC/BadD/HgdB